MPGTAHSGGHRQKSRQEHELAGTFRKDRHAELHTPEPPVGRPDPPVLLGEMEHAEWDRMITRLEQSRSLSVVDDGALFQYCRLYGETERVAEQQAEAQAAVQILEENLSDVKSEDLVQLFGQIVILRKLIAKCTDQLRQGRMALRQYLVEFGLTPVSRTRVKLPPKQDEVDAFTAYQRGRVA